MRFASQIRTVAVLVFAVAQSAAAQFSIVVNTPNDEFDASPNATCALREAIQSANTAASFGGCTITGAAGPYEISLSPVVHALSIAGIDEDANASGDLDVIAWVTLAPSAAGLATVDGADLDRVFDLHPGSRLGIEDVVIRNGSVTGDGGGLRIITAELNAMGCVIEDNDATGNGAGIFADTGVTITITQCEIRGNVADVDQNSSSRGGAMYAADPGAGNTNLVNISYSTLAENNGDTFGGAISTLGTTTTTVNIFNSTVSGNTVNTSGGGLSAGGPMLLDAVTVVGNTSNTTSNTLGGGGVRRVNGTVTMRSTIVANNDAVLNTCDDLSGTATGFVTLGANLIGDNTCLEAAFPAGSPNGSGDWVGTDGAPIDPMLGALADNGGPTRTHAVLPGSVALDNGNTALLDDQRLEPRDATPDIGSYEAGIPVAGAPQPVPGREFVLSTVAPNPSSASARLTLSVAEAQVVSVTLIDAAGRTVARIHDGLLPANTDHVLSVDGSNLAAGVYLIRVRGERFEDTRTVVFR